MYLITAFPRKIAANKSKQKTLTTKKQSFHWSTTMNWMQVLVFFFAMKDHSLDIECFFVKAFLKYFDLYQNFSAGNKIKHDFYYTC